MSSELSLWYLRFSSREVNILLLLLEGKKSEEIARALGISRRAVEFHLHEIKEKLSIRKNIERLHEGFAGNRAIVSTST
ncbi:MAG: helix-turn-helix transcriptional regulator [Armatimonadetes bacterium]|nr:helix-turn-helix transcriptional regulator [Armatimonadota bacterium]